MKHGRQHGGSTGKEVGASAGTKQAAGRAATERSTHVCPLAVLHQNQTDHSQGRQVCTARITFTKTLMFTPKLIAMSAQLTGLQR